MNIILGDYQHARRDAEQASRLPDPHGFVLDLQVYYLLATIYSHLGEHELAHQSAETEQDRYDPNSGPGEKLGLKVSMGE